MAEKQPDSQDLQICQYLLELTEAEDVQQLNQILTTITKQVTQAPKIQLNNQPDKNTSSTYRITVDDERSIELSLEQPVQAFPPELWNFITTAYRNLYNNLERANTDRLTSLLNRQSLERKLSRILQQAPHECRSHAIERIIVIFDIDHFKKVNDSLGHLYGDEVLLRVAQTAEKMFRVDDWLFRYGGEEFIIILHDVNLTSAHSILERFRKAIEDLHFPALEGVTVSIGFSELEHSLPMNDNLEHADKALYYSKNNGRNQTHCYEWLRDDGKLDKDQPTGGDVELF
ncbi:MAG: GGDEF domain-containing protein [Cellvibrionaceae bacterium]